MGGGRGRKKKPLVACVHEVLLYVLTCTFLMGLTLEEINARFNGKKCWWFCGLADIAFSKGQFFEA